MIQGTSRGIKEKREKTNRSGSICLRYLHASLSGPGVDEILYLTITLVNSSSKKEF